MDLIADRFLPIALDPAATQHDGSRAVDLASGGVVRIVTTTADGGAGDRRWMARCDDLHRVSHPVLAPLLDYGCLGEAVRFEAWSCGLSWSGADDAAEHARALANDVLSGLGMTSAMSSEARAFHGGTGAPVVIPPLDAGYPLTSDERASNDAREPALMLVDRPETQVLTELFDVVDECRPRMVAVWGPAGAGKATTAMALARAARLHGFVPVDARRLHAGAALPRRSLFVIDDESDRSRDVSRCGVSSWLRATLRDPRPHICLVLAEERPAGIDGVALRRLSVEALVSAVRPASLRHDRRRDVRRAAEQSRGLPGAFARALWRSSAFEPSRRPARSRVAERQAVYGSVGQEETRIAADVASSTTAAWPAPGELSALRKRIEAAHALLADGRHAPGLRLLRQTIGALARRDAWQNAAHGALVLATMALRRGRPREALSVVLDVDEYAAKARDDGIRLAAAIVAGHAWIDLTRLDEAERVFRAAAAAARATGDRANAGATATGLARCLFWRGAYADGEAVLAHAGGDAAAPDAAIARLRVLATLAAARGDSARSIAMVEDARAAARAHAGAHVLDADIAETAALVQLILGDFDGVDREVHACLTATASTKDPMRRLSAALIKIEADRRRRASGVRASLAACRRLAQAAPPILRHRWQLLEALVDAPDVVGIARRRAASSGLGALLLFAGEHARTASLNGHDPFVDEIVGILQLCQTVEDESGVLSAVCARLRRHLRAAAATVLLATERGAEPFAGDGQRMDGDVGARAIQSGICIAPHRIGERVEAAAAVHYGGTVAGAMCVRWTPGAADDLSRVPDVLSMAAAAIAPLLGAVLARRAQVRVPGVAELLGVTHVAGELRRAAERAAAAPFAVLIEGESGAGKEIVARAVHRCGPRRDRPFCTLNCAALPDDLVESELFGHARGAFTGAVAERAGVFEEAHGGTLFLDEVGELSLRAQAKLLRVIQEGELRRIGENVSRRVDVRIVSATNRDLRREADAGRFRIDLLYRLDVIRIIVPPLRERREDVQLLVEHFWSDATRRVGSRATLAPATRAALGAYDWPGNVRELQNVLAALAVRSAKRGLVPPTALPPHLTIAAPSNGSRLAPARRTFEQAFVRSALVRAGGHRGRAAVELGVSRQGLSKLMARLGIQ